MSALVTMVMTLLIIAAAFLMGESFGDFCAKREAIKAGHAEYYLDKDGERQWRWLPTAKAEERL